MKQKVYVIENTETNRVKIGISHDVKRRLCDLTIGSGCKLRIYYTTCYLNNARQIEKEAHQYFKDYRHIGEWFDINPENAMLYLKTLLLIHNIDEYGGEFIAHKVAEKIKPQEIYDYDEHLLTEPLTKFKRITKNVYYRKSTKEYFEIKYKNHQWIIKKIREY